MRAEPQRGAHHTGPRQGGHKKVQLGPLARPLAQRDSVTVKRGRERGHRTPHCPGG